MIVFANPYSPQRWVTDDTSNHFITEPSKDCVCIGSLVTLDVIPVRYSCTGVPICYHFYDE